MTGITSSGLRNEKKKRKRILTDERKFDVIGIFWNLIGQFTYLDS